MAPRWMILAAVAGILASCATTSASGPKFDPAALGPPAPGQARLYVYRDKVFYLAQAPTVAQADITVDGRSVGRLANGGFLTADLPVGPHVVAAASGADRTSRYIEIGPGAVYVEVFDKTRMEGARALPAAAAGGLVGGAVGGALAGAAIGAAQSAQSDQEGRIWGMDQVAEAEALPRLVQLSKSE